MDAPCHAPAQDLLTLNEMRDYLTIRRLPDDITVRAATCLSSRELMTDAAISFHHASPYALTDVISWDELAHLRRTGEVPADFPARIGRIIADEVCVNCDGVQCMDCRLRYHHETCARDCPDCCVVTAGP